MAEFYTLPFYERVKRLVYNIFGKIMLINIAKIVLSVSATQFEFERNFSISGTTQEDRR